MGLDDCDQLAVGKKADIIMIDLMQPNMQPENHLVKNIVYSGSKQNVAMTMVNGQILYENGQFFIGFDPKEIYGKRKCDYWSHEIKRGKLCCYVLLMYGIRACGGIGSSYSGF